MAYLGKPETGNRETETGETGDSGAVDKPLVGMPDLYSVQAVIRLASLQAFAG